jgi:hypothetical protein
MGVVVALMARRRGGIGEGGKLRVAETADGGDGGHDGGNGGSDVAPCTLARYSLAHHGPLDRILQLAHSATCEEGRGERWQRDGKPSCG